MAFMNLREWGSSSKEFSQFVADKDKVTGVVCNVLGFIWNHERIH